MLPNERTTRSEVVALPGEVEALIAAPTRAAARSLVDFLKAEGINVQLVVDADSAFEEALLHRPNVLLIDDRLPPSGGVELCQRLKGNGRTHFLPAIILAQGDGKQHRLRALSAGADAVFAPSTDEQERRARLWALLRTEALHRQQQRLQRTQGAEFRNRRRWVGGFVHDLQSAIGALQANFEYLGQCFRSKGRPSVADIEECQTDTAIVFRQVARGLRNVLDYERFESGRMALKEGPVSMGTLADEVRAELDWYAATAGKSLVVERPGREPVLRGDGEQLKEAVISLASFVLHQPGNRHAVIKVQPQPGLVRVSIGGDGERIDEQDRERIFEPYARAGGSATAGHGLGLALARVVVELHGGTIRVEDVQRAGSAFVIELPSDRASPKLRTVE
jgi:K+-sensing histidine kinase KdpD